MFSIFGQYSTRGPIELNTSLVRFVEQIQKNLLRPMNYEEIRVLMDAPEEDISLDDLWSIMFYFITCYMLLFYVVEFRSMINFMLLNYVWLCCVILFLKVLIMLAKIFQLKFMQKMFM